LRAFAKAGVPGAVLIIVGEGPLRTELEAEAAALGISDRVRFLGFVNQLGMPALYTAADLFVLPSEYDACPAVVCEAMLCGVPVLLSDQIRGRFDLVLPGNTGDIFPCGDIEALAGKIRELLTDPGRLHSMGVAARKQMDSCTPQTNVAALLEALHRLDARPPSIEVLSGAAR
jgi:glycosyltransferase involved in cell wall biosynthesis